MTKLKEDHLEVDHGVCGIVMPISGTNEYPKQHWVDVKLILESAIEEAGFKPNLVSDADDVGIIHNRIVKNLAENPIVVCDVSSKNPNVMFELGLRLAFDKATIVIKDEITTYNFDTSPIEHLIYPSDLHYHSIIDFRERLKDKLIRTYEASKSPDYSTFLKHFVQYKPKLQEKEIGINEFLVNSIKSINLKLSELSRNGSEVTSDKFRPSGEKFIKENDLQPLIADFKNYAGKKFDDFDAIQLFNEFMNFINSKHPLFRSVYGEDYIASQFLKHVLAPQNRIN